MRSTLFVAGATGVIGSRLVPLLISRGYRVFGLTRSADKAPTLWDQGAVPIVADAFDATALAQTMRAARPDTVIHVLTDLPRGLDPGRMEEGVRRNSRMRSEGTAGLVAAARENGVGLMVAQSIAWAYAPGNTPHTEDAPLDLHADGLRAVTIAGIVALERAVLNTGGMKGIVLRFGQLYGPGTGRDDAAGLNLPLHVDAAVDAVLLAMESGRPGIYNVVGPNAEVAIGKYQDLMRESGAR